MSERERGRGCLRFGCLGCVALVTLPIVVAALIALFALLTRPEPPVVETVERRRAIEMPAPIDDHARGVPERLELAGPGAEPIDVELDLSIGTFTVLAAPAGSAIRVEGEYDRSAFELVESFEPTGDGRWSYKLEVKRRVALLSMLFHPEDTPSLITVHLPREVPIDLETRVGAGETILELGGLDLRSAEISAGVGKVDIRFSEPTARPMERFRLSSGIGECAVFGLGNASPATVEIEGSIGEMLVGLDGRWRADSRISARLGMGEMKVGQPSGVRLELAGVRQSMGEHDLDLLLAGGEESPGAPTLYLTLSQRVGQISAH